MVIPICALIEIRLYYSQYYSEKWSRMELVFDLSFVVTNMSAANANVFSYNSKYIDGVS